MGLIAFLGLVLLSGCQTIDETLREIELCGKVRRDAGAVANRSAIFKFQLSSEDGGLLLEPRQRAALLDAQGEACVTFDSWSVDHARLALLTVPVEGEVADGQVENHWLTAPEVGRSTLHVRASFDFAHPKQEEPGNLSRYLLKKAFERRRDPPPGRVAELPAKRVREPVEAHEAGPAAAAAAI